MKPFVMLSLVMLAAIPAGADEPETRATATTSAPEGQASSTTTAADENESPLVRAARRANRLGKKPRTVITNETVKNSKGHITTTTIDRPVYIPDPKMAPSEAEALKKRADEREKERVRVIGEEKAKAEEQKALERRARAAEMAEDGYLEDEEDDPARAERDAEATGTASDEKPPQR